MLQSLLCPALQHEDTRWYVMDHEESGQPYFYTMEGATAQWEDPRCVQLKLQPF